MTTIIPQYHAFFNPLLEALRDLGGSASIQELNEKIIERMNFSGDALARIHNSETSNDTEIEYRLAWARTYLKKYGLIENSTRGIWSLTEKADVIDHIDPDQVLKYVRDKSKAEKTSKSLKDAPTDEIGEEPPAWKSELHRLLTKNLDPKAFERLIQRLLRESGFIQVEVTGRVGDGGIDGKGIAKIHGLMSFHVIFQCKRYQGVVSSSEIRDFRGAMVGRADKGLFITTGSFTKDAVKEATRDGAPPIDLLDGDTLAEKLLELRLGVNVEMIERVTVNSHFFATI
ncbi:MAG: restriction endonuclease [Isosphaeraceae bacterium]